MVDQLKLRVLLIAALVLVPAMLFAQSPLGQIVGIVRDPTGAVLPNAKATITNHSTSFQRTTDALADGTYFFTDVEPGGYTLEVDAAGFKRYTRTEIVLQTRQTLRLDVTMEVGLVSDSVTVTGGAPVVNSETATIGESLSSAQIENSYLALPMFQTPAELIGNYSLQSVGIGQAVYKINGSRASQVRFTRDGQAEDVYWGFPPTTSVQETRMTDVNATAEFATPATIATTTKGGSNEFHAAAEYTLSNNALNALGPLGATRGPGVGSYNSSFGGSGPVILPKLYNGRNKTFFTATYERSKSRDSQFIPFVNVPTVPMRSGDFSQLKDTSGNLMPIIDPLSGQPFANNTIPASRINGVASNIVSKLYPTPNTGTAASTIRNYTTLAHQFYDYGALFARFDQKLSEKNTANFGFTRRTQSARFDTAASGRSKVPGEYYAVQQQNMDGFSLADVHVFGPRLLNEFRVSYDRFVQPSGTDVKGQDILKQLGMQGIDPGLNYTGLPGIILSGFAGIGVVYNDNTFTENRFSYMDNVSFQTMRHSFKFGANYIRFQDNTAGATGTVFGDYSFTGRFTRGTLQSAGSSFADFLLGYPDTTARFTPRAAVAARNYVFGAYVQDDFRISPRVTLNIGLRYDLEGAPYDNNDLYFNFDPKTGGIVLPSSKALQNVSNLFNTAIPRELASDVGFPSRLISPDRNNFNPRIGIAYRPFASATAAIRAGYGLYTVGKVGSANRGSGSTFLQTTGPFALTESFTNTQASGAAPMLSLSTPFQGTGSGASSYSVSAVNPNIHDGYMQQWNISIEQEVLKTAFRVSYIGSKSNNLPYSRNINLPPPSTTPFTTSRYLYTGFSSIGYIDQGANAHYNSMQVEFTHPTGHGLYLHGGWTWANEMTDSESGYGLTGSATNPYDRNYDRGRADFLPRHRFQFDWSYELPFGRGKSLLATVPGVVNQIVGGWVFSGYWRVQGGQPYTVYYSGTDPSGMGIFSGRPDRIASGKLSNASQYQWFDPSAFVIPASNIGRLGNSGRNILEAPATHAFLMGVHKYFDIAERVKLRISGYFYDPFNQHDWGTPGNYITASDVGVLSSPYPFGLFARTIQLGARLAF